jgi:hypothetical protein
MLPQRQYSVWTCVGKLSDVLHHVEGGSAVLRVARHILQALQQHVVAHHQVRQVLVNIKMVESRKNLDRAAK